MRKVLSIVKKVLLSKRLNDLVLDVAIVALFFLAVILLFVKSENIWAKVFAIGYLLATATMAIFLRIPNIPPEMYFGKTSLWSFLTWNVLYSIIGGIIIGCFIGKISGTEIIQTCLVTTSMVTIIISLIWFIYQIQKKEDNTARLDLYSSIVMVILTLLSLALDYSSIKIQFLLIFFVYLIIQILIKIKICKITQSR
jgi:hypothetical protein